MDGNTSQEDTNSKVKIFYFYFENKYFSIPQMGPDHQLLKNSIEVVIKDQHEVTTTSWIKQT